MQNNSNTNMIDINLIIPNKYQPRKVFDESALDTLAESIKNYGIINPILVRKKDDKYEIIAGERRFRAAKKIGLTEVPVIIKNVDEQQTAELALIENLERQGLSAIEEAKSYEEIMRIGNQTQESLAKKIGKSQSSIANKIRLLSLPQEIQDALANKKISERHARSLLNVKNKEKQLQLLNRIMTERLTVKETDRIINEQEIDEDEIKQAISDIMKSLNIKEDEKEDDNMNNGNFFPNFDNNNTVNNNASLNMMNMQSMNQAPMQPAPEVVMPTMAPPMPEPVQMPAMEPMMQPPVNETPMFTPQPEVNMNNSLNPMSGFMNQPMPEPVQMPAMEPMMQPPVNATPMFTPQPEVPQMDNVSPLIDTPLFNPNVIMPGAEQSMPEPVQVPTMEPVVPVVEPTPMNSNSFEIPVVAPQPEAAPVDKLAQLQELLNSNGYTFKSFSNETEDCIIIELPRN